MHITLVGKRGNRRVICWRPCLKLTVATVLGGGFLSTAAYVVLAQRWNSLAPLAGMSAGLVAAVMCLVASLLTPLPRLPVIGDMPPPPPGRHP